MKRWFVLSVLCVVLAVAWGGYTSVQAQDGLDDFVPSPLQAQLSEDGNTLESGVPPRIYIADPVNPVNVHYVPPPVPLVSLDPKRAVSSFSISYYAAGEKDPWDEPCYDFPADAKTAFSAAAAIWANTVQSTIPVSIKACWASLSSASILGYSGGGPLHRNFTGAKRTNTWYMGSLANSMAGSDLSTSKDMYITYNKNFSWYYGTDGATPAGQHDLMSVVLHEIGHGLNFAGSMKVEDDGKGYYGYATAPINPNVYDVYMKNNAGTYLTTLGNGTTALATALKSNGVTFNGTRAKAANGGSAVKIYTPTTWAGGSSYSHLDYTTFNDTANELMVYAISSGEAIHDPGPVAKGLLRDIGWNMKGTSGFDSPFTSNYKGWKTISGAWSLSGGAFFTDGLSGKWSTAAYVNAAYSNFQYEARVKRTVASTYTNAIFVRGNPIGLDSNNRWLNAYMFGYRNTGSFCVYRFVSGVATTLKGWTASSLINKGGWNSLKVVAVGSALKFFINGKLVWSGTDASFSSGYVGLAMYRASAVERFYVDWARLDTLLTGATAPAPSEPFPSGEMTIAPDDEVSGEWAR
jgi:hypothetical protein